MLLETEEAEDSSVPEPVGVGLRGAEVRAMIEKEEEDGSGMRSIWMLSSSDWVEALSLRRAEALVSWVVTTETFPLGKRE
jgi:flagellar biosynthesis/type III secretory pathway ATPase